MNPQALTVRPCVESDAATLATLVRGLAVYEELGHLAAAGPDAFRAHLFGPRPVAEAVLAELGGVVAGFALFFPTFSTFRGRPGIYLEDLFVRTEFRGRGVGKALIASVARAAVARGCAKLEWSVLARNVPAVAFYQHLGAQPLGGRDVYRIDDGPLARLAASAPAGQGVGTG